MQIILCQVTGVSSTWIIHILKLWLFETFAVINVKAYNNDILSFQNPLPCQPLLGFDHRLIVKAYNIEFHATTMNIQQNTLYQFRCQLSKSVIKIIINFKA